MNEEKKPVSTETITQDDVNQIKNKGLSYYKLSEIAAGTTVTLEIMNMEKIKNAKYCLKDKDYALRCFLGNGQVMDVSSSRVAGALMRLVVIADGKMVPFKIEINKKVTSKIGESPYTIVPVV